MVEKIYLNNGEIELTIFKDELDQQGDRNSFAFVQATNGDEGIIDHSGDLEIIFNNLKRLKMDDSTRINFLRIVLIDLATIYPKYHLVFMDSKLEGCNLYAEAITIDYNTKVSRSNFHAEFGVSFL